MNLKRLISVGTLVALLTSCAGAQPAPAPVTAPVTTTAPADSVTRSEAANLRAPRTPDAGLLERVVVLGSSASAGFRTPATLNVLVEPMIAVEHQPVSSAASSMFFLEPEQTGENLAAAAAAIDPTLVIALDYLFWFGYGDVESERSRFVLLELGLEKLERFECPVIVSPYPVVTQAVGKILYAAQVPTDATLKALDARVLEWAEENDNVFVVSVPDIYAQLMKAPPIEVAGQSWPAGEGVMLMQDDALHPTIEGMAAVSALILQDLIRQRIIPADSVNLDLAACLAEASGEPVAEPAGTTSTEPPSTEPASPSGQR